MSSKMVIVTFGRKLVSNSEGGTASLEITQVQSVECYDQDLPQVGETHQRCLEFMNKEDWAGTKS